MLWFNVATLTSAQRSLECGSRTSTSSPGRQEQSTIAHLIRKAKFKKIQATRFFFFFFFPRIRCRGEDPGKLQEELQPRGCGLPVAGHDPGSRQTGAHRQAAPKAVGRRPQSPGLLSDGTLPGHPGGLPHPETVRSRRRATTGIASSFC